MSEIITTSDIETARKHFKLDDKEVEGVDEQEEVKSQHSAGGAMKQQQKKSMTNKQGDDDLDKYPNYSDNTEDIIKYECKEVTFEEQQKIWDPEQNPAYKKQLMKEQRGQKGGAKT